MTVAYADSDGVSIAYEVVGGTGCDLILMPPVGTRAVASVMPIFRRYYEGLARFSRLVVYDRRGMGMSDASPDAPTMEQHVADLDAVRRAIGGDKVFLTTGHLGSLCLFAYYLAHREHVAGMILMNPIACDAREPEDPIGAHPIVPWADLDRLSAANFDAMTRAFVERGLPKADAASREQQVRYYKAALTPSTFRKQLQFARGFDPRARLGEIAVPVLLIYSARDPSGVAAHGRYLQTRLPHARSVELDTDALLPWAEPDSLTQILHASEEFLSGRVLHTVERSFVALVVTDIVDSTVQQRRRGDAAWKLLRQEFEEVTRRRVEQRGGQILQFLGDGVLASFPLASEALHGAESLVAAARELGIEIRVGVHAGEAERHGRELSGIAVNIAARVGAAAAGSEVLVSSTVRDLVEGAGFRFGTERTADLKGVGLRRVVPLVH